MTAKEAVKIVVQMAKDAPGEQGEALQKVLAALKERDKLAVSLEEPVRLMAHRLEGALP